jgi:hypothetical protein
MADMTDAQKKRQEARRKRRSQSEKPKPEQDDSSDTQNGEPLEAVKQAAKVAAAGAAVGAAAAAARAFAHHGNDDGSEQQTDEPEAAEPEAEAQQDDEPKAEQPEEQQPEAQQPEAQQQGEPEPAPAPEPEPVQGASLGEAGKAMRTARDQLQELLGKAVESASALERTQNGWVTTLEVVEVSRIPETTDVLASYELELDENLGLRSYRQVRRYSRSQAQRDDQ